LKTKTSSRSTCKKKQTWEGDRLQVLKFQELAGEIVNLDYQPAYILKGERGLPVATYTPDYRYKLKVPMYGLPVGTVVVEEFKGHKDAHSSKRLDYLVFRRWLQIDHPEIVFIENTNGVFKFPNFRPPKCPKNT
jgi:hypothetical protein